MIGLKKSVSGAVLCLLWLAACDGGSSSASDPTATGLTLTLSNSGVSPQTSFVFGSSLITVLNNDNAVHQLASNPNPQQVDCPELNTPVLSPGDSFIATISDQIGTCGFIDSLNPTDSSFQGTITVTTSNSGPSGNANGG